MIDLTGPREVPGDLRQLDILEFGDFVIDALELIQDCDQKKACLVGLLFIWLQDPHSDQPPFRGIPS